MKCLNATALWNFHRDIVAKLRSHELVQTLNPVNLKMFVRLKLEALQIGMRKVLSSFTPFSPFNLEPLNESNEVRLLVKQLGDIFNENVEHGAVKDSIEIDRLRSELDNIRLTLVIVDLKV